MYNMHAHICFVLAKFLYVTESVLFSGARSQFSIRIEFSRRTAQIGNQLDAKCHVKNEKGMKFIAKLVFFENFSLTFMIQYKTAQERTLF